MALRSCVHITRLSPEALSVSCKRHCSAEKKLPGTPLPPNYYAKESQLDASSILGAFASRKNTFWELHRINPLTITGDRFREWKARLLKTVELEQQKFLQERHDMLGSDLATAHFIVFRGGKVRFSEDGEWIQKDEDEDTCHALPNKFVRNLYLHSVDASNTNIRYEGLENFTNLTRLKWLSFRNCVHVNSWFVDRICGEFSETLEYLDIRECVGVTEDALSSIYKLKNLKTLKVSNISGSRSFEFMCLQLEEAMPELYVEGVKYLDVKEE